VRSRNLPSRRASDSTASRSIRGSPPRGAEEALEPGLDAQLAEQFPPLAGRQAVAVFDGGLELGHQLIADGGVARGRVGVAADHEAVALGAVLDHHVLDGQVAGHGVVAALAHQRRLGLRGIAARLLAQHVVAARTLQIAAVGG
jgi:hypothetical protein